MRTVVDTSAIIALVSPDDEHNAQASAMLDDAYREGALLVDPIVVAELAADPFFGDGEELATFLEETGIDRESPSPDAQYRAGEAFETYLDRRGDELHCPECGATTEAVCPDCGTPVAPRQHIASDFLIGAHAAVDADALLTFDAGFFRDYFDVDVRAIRG